MSLLSTAAEVLASLRQENIKGCLIGGLAVSARCNPRFTLDIDLAVVIDTDAQAERIMHALVARGLQTLGIVEQESVGRMAMARLSTQDGLSIDLLIASSGIEAEVVANAETLEVARGVLLPVARTGHLIALKLLSVAPGRETDSADLRNLAAVATEDEWRFASEAIQLIAERGYARERQLATDLQALRTFIF